MPSVDSLCPAFKRPLAAHLPSARYPRESVPADIVHVANGRWYPSGEPAEQPRRPAH